MRISTKGRYSLRALTHLARSFYEDGNKPVSIKEIAAREEISNRYLENIFIKLRRAGILDSSKGEKGGFKLKRSPEKISLLEILQCVENEVAPSKCVVKMSVCPRSDKCGIRKIWKRLHDHINGFLEKVSLKEIMESHFDRG